MSASRKSAGKSRTKDLSRAVTRFSNWFEAIGCVLLLIAAVFAFINGHPVLGALMALFGIIIAISTVREFAGKGLGALPPANAADADADADAEGTKD